MVDRLTVELSSVSVSDFSEDGPMCFDFLFMRVDFLLGFASLALSESESEFEEAAEDESVVVEEADDDGFLISCLGFSGAAFAAGFGGAPAGNGYFLGLPLPRPDVELPDCLLTSFTGAGGFSSSDSDEFEKILLFSFLIFEAAGVAFLGGGRFFAVFGTAPFVAG